MTVNELVLRLESPNTKIALINMIDSTCKFMGAASDIADYVDAKTMKVIKIDVANDTLMLRVKSERKEVKYEYARYFKQ